MSEVECIELFDLARTAFEYLFRQLQVESKAAAEYVEAMTKITEKREQ